MENFDLIIIGAGPGGYEVALEAAGKHGMKTALIEEKEVGGTCLNRGCIPTKTLLHSSELLHTLKKQGAAIGLTATDATDYDMGAITDRKDEVVHTLVSGVSKSLKSAGVQVFAGRGELISSHRVRITEKPVQDADNAQASANANLPEREREVPEAADGAVTEIEGKTVLLATGSKAFLPPIPGSDLPGVMNSDAFLNNREKLESLVIVGGGVIGIEFATVYSSLGCRVTLIEAVDRILNIFDKDVSQTVKLQLKRAGVEVLTSCPVQKIERLEGHGTARLSVLYQNKKTGAEDAVQAQAVLMAGGRRPASAHLIAEDADADIKALAMDKKGYILVDETYQTSVPDVYAIGDCNGGIELAHYATAEGRSFLALLTGSRPPIDMQTVPSVIYTNPEVAVVGLTADEAKENGIAVRSLKYPMGANGKSVVAMQARAYIRLLVSAEKETVLGAQIVSQRASDLISICSMAISRKMTLHDLQQLIFPHPSFAEAIGEAARL